MGKYTMKFSIKNIRMVLCMGILAVFQVPMTLADDFQDFSQIIQLQQKKLTEQQQKIDTLQRQLDLQQKMLNEMQEKLQGMSTAQGVSPTAMAGKKPTAKPVAKSLKSSPARRTDTRTNRRDKDHSHEQWKGSFGVEGTKTRLKTGGFAELDIIHDTDAIASKGQFITSTIHTGNNTNKSDGAEGQTSFSMNPTRLYLETRTPFEGGRVTTFVSMDFYGNSMGTAPDPRMRQAYGEATNILFGGDLMAGQAWTTFADLEAFPNVLDFQGPNSFFGTRQPLIRWTRSLSHRLKLMVAAETPGNHIIEGADSHTAWPDGVLSLIWDQAPIHLKGSFVARDLRGSLKNGVSQSTFGWGTSFSGKLGLPFLAKKDFMTFSATYGRGTGSNFNDQPSDAVFNTTGTSLDPIPVFGWFLSYEHWWSQHFNSTLVYGSLEADNRDVQLPNAFKASQYASGNVVWTPNTQWLIGIECLWGKREDKNNETGTDLRTQFTTRFSF